MHSPITLYRSGLRIFERRGIGISFSPAPHKTARCGRIPGAERRVGATIGHGFGLNEARARGVMANKLGAARIAALREVRGELVAVLDADDVSHPERLARQVAFLDLHPEPARDGVRPVRTSISRRRDRVC